MVLAEIAVVGVLIVVAWHALAGATSSSGAPPLLFPPAAASPADTALPGAGVPVAEGRRRGPLPGLNLGIEFWRRRLGSLNRDEAAFETLEWRITHAVMNAAHEYIESVVLPAVRRAEGGVV
jgi:hypothetical protein